MSDGSVNNSAELTLGINTTPAEQSIEKLEAKLNELVSKLQKLDGNHKVDHVVSPSAVKQIEHLTQQVKILQAELEAVRTGSAKTGGPSGVFANISKEAQELQGVIGAVDKKVARSQHNLQVMLKSAEMAGSASMQSWKTALASAYQKVKDTDTAYSGLGKSILGAKTLVDKYGEASTRAFLGPKRHLVDLIPTLDTYKTKVEDLTAAWGRLTKAQQLRVASQTATALSNNVTPAGLASSPQALALSAANGNSAARIKAEVDALSQSHAKLKTATDGSRDGMVHWNKIGHESHSLARGLAGSMNALWLTWGSTVPLLAGAALGSSFVQAAKQGSEFAYQLTFVKALSGESAAAIDALSASTLNLSKGGLFAPTEIASGFRMLAQAGLNATDALSAMPNVLNLATVGEMSMADAATTLVGVMNAFSLSVGQSEHVGDVFAKAAAVSQTSVQAMTEAMKTASVVGEQYGATIEDTATALTLLAKVNITGTAAGTSLRNMLKELYAPTEGVAKVIKQLGLETKDAQGNLRTFPDIVYQLKEKLKDFDKSSQVNILQKLFGERGAKEAIAMLGKTREEWDALRATIAESSGFADKVATQLENTTKGQMLQALNTLKSNIIQVFGELEPAFTSIATSLKDLFARDEFVSGLKAIIGAMADLASMAIKAAPALAALGAAWVAVKATMLAATAVSAIGGFASTVSMVAGAAAVAGGGLAGLAQAIRVVASASSIAGGAAGIGGLASALAMLSNHVGLAVGALTVAGAAMYLFRDRTAEAMEQSTSKVIAFATEAKEQLEDVARTLGTTFASVSQTKLQGIGTGLTAMNDRLSAQRDTLAKQYGLVGEEQIRAAAKSATTTDSAGGVYTQETARSRSAEAYLAALKERDQVSSRYYQLKQDAEDKAAYEENKRAAEVAGSNKPLKTFSLDDKKGGNKADKDALRANIVEMQGWIRELSQLEKQAQDELATSFNEGTVTATEYWEGRLELANSYTALEIAAIDGLISSQKGLSKSELAQLTAKKKLLEVNLDGGNEAARDRAKSESLSKLKLSYDKVIDSAKKQIALYKNDTVFEALSRQTDEFGRQDLEVERSVEAFRLAEIAKVEALNLANRQNKDLTASQLAGIDAITEAERQALMERLNLKRQHEGNWLNGVDESWKAWKDSANNAAKIAGQSFSTIFKKVDDVMLDFIRTGKLNFKSLGQTIKDEVIKLLYELTVKQFVIGIAGDFSGLAMAIGGTALKSILGVSGSGGSSVGSSGGSTDYLGMASNASTAYSAYGYLSNAYQYGLADTAQGAYYSLANYLNPAPAAGQFTVPTYSQHLADYAASQGADVSAMGTVAEPAGSAATGTLSAGTFLSYVGIAYAITQAISAIATAGGRKPFQYDGLEVKGDYDGKNFTGQAATNWKAKGGWWQNGAQTSVWVPLTDSITDLRAAAERLYGWNTTVIGEGATGGYTYTPIQEANLASLTSSGMGIMSPNPEYAQWLSAYNESNWVGRPDVSEGYYYNGEEKVYAPEKSTYSGFYGPTRVQPISMDPNILGAIDLAIETAFNAPKAAMKKVAETFGDSELVTKIDAFTAKINVSGQTIGEILGKIGTQVTTDLGQAFLPAVEAARVQGAALRTGLETAIANATTAGDTAAVQTLQAQMAAIGIVAAETWNQTFERVLKETDAVTKVMDLLGVSLKDIGDANKVLTLSDNLVTLFGSIDAMNTSINAYYGNFYTEAEKQERAWKGMSETFKSLNLTMPTTREGFRDLVDAQDLTTAAGQQTFVALMNVQGAFANLTPAMDAVVASVTTLIVTAEQLRSAKSSLMGYFNTDQKRMVLTGEISDVAKENGVDLGAESLSNLGNATRTQFAQYVQSVANEGTEASRRMLVALAAIAPIFEDLATLAEDIARADLETAITNTQTAITNTQTAIDDLVTQYGDVTAAMEEINAPAKNLVDTWRGAETELASLQAAFDDLFGGTVQTLIEQARQTAAMRDTFAAGAGNALDAARDARTSAMTPEQRADFWRQQEQSLWQGLGTATDKGAVISQIMSAYANTRSAEFDALEANQSTVQKDALQTQIDAWKTTLSVIEQSKRLVEDIDKTLAGLAYSDLSNLGYTGQLGAASSSYSNTLSKAAAGDVNAMGDLTSIARDYLTEAQTYFGGATLDYSNVYDKVTGDLRGLGVGLNTDGTGAQSEIDRLTASLASLPTDIKNAFDMETADGYGRIAVALDAGTQFNTARLDEQRAQLQTQIDQQKTVIANQEAQIRQQAENHAALMARLIEQNGRLATLESNSNLATVAA